VESLGLEEAGSEQLLVRTDEDIKVDGGSMDSNSEGPDPDRDIQGIDGSPLLSIDH